MAEGLGRFRSTRPSRHEGVVRCNLAIVAAAAFHGNLIRAVWRAHDVSDHNPGLADYPPK